MTDEIRRYSAASGAVLGRPQGRPVTPLWRTADWGYLRFHEGTARPWPRYGPPRCSSGRPAAATGSGWDVFVYFNNDPGGAAVADAVVFADAVRRAGGTPTRVPTADQAAGRRLGPATRRRPG